MSGKVTTHVLDLAAGKPVVGISIELWYLGEECVRAEAAHEPRFIGAYRTNEDGRVDEPLLEGENIQSGIYEIIFAAGEFFRRTAYLSAISESIFDKIPIRFRIHDKSSHYHVPLLVAPGGYSTYRGS
ncbi:hydroxyisourate hydrolase [Bacillus sp. FJAT-28004]|uniref:hydroxyisourate hydrolase n=1 Tax=Bacillus sp. FJAT-28004 TaxID=1679165 RepID=UPI0006B59A13|nr:hydroxyisourate hydrolase [Bacillus sp. FJAT-28004]